LKFEGTTPDDLPTGEIPVVRPADPRVTISGAEVAAEAAGIRAGWIDDLDASGEEMAAIGQ